MKGSYTFILAGKKKNILVIMERIGEIAYRPIYKKRFNNEDEKNSILKEWNLC